MTYRLVKQALTTYLPAVQEVIAQPARCVVVKERELVTTFDYRYVNLGRSWYWWAIPRTTWVETQRIECYPAVEAVEGRDAAVVLDNQPGWNSGARSHPSVAGDCLAVFTPLAGSVGVLCGLASVLAATGQFGAVEHGVLTSIGENPRVVESGVVVATSPYSLTSGEEVRIARSGGRVQYQVGQWVYDSSARSSGSKALYAVLYSAGDGVDDPSVSVTQPLSSSVQWGWRSPAEDNALRARGSWGWGGEATMGDGWMADTLLVRIVAADYDYGNASLDVGSLELDAAGGFVGIEAGGVATVVPFSLYAAGVDIDYGQGGDTIELSMTAADYDYGFGYLDAGALESFGYDSIDPDGSGSSSEAMAVIDTYTFDPVLFASITDGVVVGSTVDVVLGLDGQYADFLGLTDAAVGTQVIEALIAAGVQLSDNASNVARVLLQYATNAVTGAVARYQGFDFLGFQYTDAGTFAWKKDGLYQVGGDTDNGALLRAVLDFAAEDFGTAERKRIDTIFLGLSTDGQVFLRTTDDQNREVTYRAVQRGSEYRSNLQRGVSSRFWRLRLELVDASYADLDNVEWVTGATGRRTTR